MPWNILKEYRITEKTNRLSSTKNCYTFEVVKHANRISIAKAVEAAFKVKVSGVKILNRKPKIRRSRMRKSLPGSVGGMKKAMVFLKKGYHIEVI